jgi:hypothetical protein
MSVRTRELCGDASALKQVVGVSVARHQVEPDVVAAGNAARRSTLPNQALPFSELSEVAGHDVERPA